MAGIGEERGDELCSLRRKANFFYIWLLASFRTVQLYDVFSSFKFKSSGVVNMRYPGLPLYLLPHHIFYFCSKINFLFLIFL